MWNGQPYVYMMANRYLGTLYIGVTSDLPGRVTQHRAETFRGFTARHGVKRLVWYESAETMADVIISEKRIKKWRRDWKIMLIERVNPHWEDLAAALGLPPLDH